MTKRGFCSEAYKRGLLWQALLTRMVETHSFSDNVLHVLHALNLSNRGPRITYTTTTLGKIERTLVIWPSRRSNFCSYFLHNVRLPCTFVQNPCQQNSDRILNRQLECNDVCVMPHLSGSDGKEKGGILFRAESRTSSQQYTETTVGFSLPKGDKRDLKLIE